MCDADSVPITNEASILSRQWVATTITTRTWPRESTKVVIYLAGLVLTILLLTGINVQQRHRQTPTRYY